MTDNIFARHNSKERAISLLMKSGITHFNAEIYLLDMTESVYRFRENSGFDLYDFKLLRLQEFPNATRSW
ncbi:MAG: hypothetical protein CMI01_15470 [Oceanospirillaceae bacterium]|nr:hypothetical protein [Oceanospirillaceae bacterium]